MLLIIKEMISENELQILFSNIYFSGETIVCKKALTQINFVSFIEYGSTGFKIIYLFS